MENIDVALLVSRWIHIVAAMVAIGGAAFMRFALIPGMGAALEPEQQQRLREAVRSKWAKFTHGCIGLLLLTGFANFYMVALSTKMPANPYHFLFGPKLLLALVVFFLAIALVGRSPGFEGLRKKARTWLGVVIALAIVIVLISGTLNQIRMNKPAADTAPAITPAD